MKYLILFITVTIFFSCNNQSYFNKGYDKFLAGNYSDAVKLLTKEIEINPNNVNAFDLRAKSKFALQDYFGALEDTDKAINIKPHPAHFNSRSACNAALGNFKSSIEDATRSIELAVNYAGNYFEPYLNRAEAYKQINENGKAILDYTEVLRLNPGNLTALISRGVTFQKLNDLTSACKDWASAADLGSEVGLNFYEIYCE